MCIRDSGSTVNISGGTFGNDFSAFNGSTVDISGGTFGNGFRSLNNFGSSTVSISGGDFLLNGNAINDISSPFTLSGEDVFTGTLEDGSSFIFSNINSDSLNGVNLIETSTPTLDTTPQIINTASTLRSLRAGQTLTVQGGGETSRDLSAVDATLNIESGAVVGSNTEVARSEVNISGGTVGEAFSAYASAVNISGGVVGSDFGAFSDSAVNISGGTVGNGFNANSDSRVNICLLYTSDAADE